MTTIDEEFERTLDALRRKHRDRPARELEHLLLVALEREQLVTVAYRNDLMAERLEESSLDGELVRVFRQSLAWAWKDEQMHAIYTRGLLFRWGRYPVRLRAVLQQLAGAIGGWASSIQQHVPWKRAPISRAVAGLVAKMGLLGGRVPKAVRRELRYLSFGEFCRIQVDAEASAAACWKRLAEIAGLVPGIDEPTCSELKRMWRDEISHRSVFEIIASCLAEREGPSEVIPKLRAVGEFFVPRLCRTGDLARHPLGAGGEVHVLKGAPDLEKREALRVVLEKSRLSDRLAEKADALGKPVSELRILVKATFMLGYDRRHRAIITDPELLDELARFLRERSTGPVFVGDGRNIYDRYCENRDVGSVAAYFGMDSDNYLILDLTEDQISYRYSHGMAQYTVSRSWRDADFRIVFAKLRSHPVDFTHLTLGAIQGIGARLEEFLFLERAAHRDTALLMPLVEFPPDFALIDGYESAADGLVGIIACPRHPRPYRIYAGADALAVDMVATRHLGLARPRDSYLLDAACHWFGDPGGSTTVVGTDDPVPGWRSPYANEVTSLLSLLANPVYQLLSGRGSTFLPPMDNEAFPLREKTSFTLGLERAVLRKLLGMV